jgi:hypothetical protein
MNRMNKRMAMRRVLNMVGLPGSGDELIRPYRA